MLFEKSKYRNFFLVFKIVDNALTNTYKSIYIAFIACQAVNVLHWQIVFWKTFITCIMCMLFCSRVKLFKVSCNGTIYLSLFWFTVVKWLTYELDFNHLLLLCKQVNNSYNMYMYSFLVEKITDDFCIWWCIFPFLNYLKYSSSVKWN